jgi:4-hydroxy-4-methyl-2-oxoglutarate aldolase
MAKILHSVGCVGIVTDGGVRDVEGLLTVPFAAYSRGRTIHHVALRYTSYNRPIEIGGIRVSPGEVIHANIGGVIKIPAGCLQALPERAAVMRSLEHQTHCIWRQTGVPIDEKLTQVRVIYSKAGF